MSLGLNVLLRNARLDAIRSFAGDAALIRIYSGTRPATGASLGAAVLLAQLTCASNGSGSGIGNAAANGTLTLNSISPANSAAATGQAAFFRMFKSDGTTFIADGSVSTQAQGTGDMRLDDVNIVLGGTVAISNGSIVDGNA